MVCVPPSRVGDDADEAMKVLKKHGIARKLGQEAIEMAQQQGGFTIFAVVDALTQLSGRHKKAGDRSEADAKASALLALAAEA